MLQNLPLGLFADTATSSTAGAAGNSLSSTLMFILPLGLMFVILYFMMIRPQRKKDKQTAKMRNELQVGDEVTTIGGIIGRVVMIKEDSIVIETGADRNKVRIKRWAVQTNETIHDA